MNNLWTIFKKEFLTYFETAIGYIFLIVFLLIGFTAGVLNVMRAAGIVRDPHRTD